MKMDEFSKSRKKPSSESILVSCCHFLVSKTVNLGCFLAIIHHEQDIAVTMVMGSIQMLNLYIIFHNRPCVFYFIKAWKKKTKQNKTKQKNNCKMSCPKVCQPGKIVNDSIIIVNLLHQYQQYHISAFPDW